MRESDSSHRRFEVARLRNPVCALWLSLLLASTVLCQPEHGRKKALAVPTPFEVESVRQSAHRLVGDAQDYDPLMKLIGDARFVLLGEATHGTREFYRERARIARRLIEEKGFNLVVLEADWPDAYRVNDYVRGRSKDQSAEQALSGFTRFPRWMWRNSDSHYFESEMSSGRPPQTALTFTKPVTATSASARRRPSLNLRLQAGLLTSP